MIGRPTLAKQISLLIVTCISIGTVGGAVTSAGVFTEKSIELPKGRAPAHAVGNMWLRHFIATQEIPSKTGSPVFVVCKEREVWYIDTGNLKVLEKRQYLENESIQISQNGKYLSVYSGTWNERTGKTHMKMRLETWEGSALWEMEYSKQSTCEPTPTGGYIAYPTPHPKDGWASREMIPRSVDPPPLPHGLRVYDSDGSLLLEGVDYAECRRGIRGGAISSDGKYLGLVFVSVAPENRVKRRSWESNKACLILYDIEDGTELWRHYFDGIRPCGILVSPHAERIVCFVTSKGDEFVGADNYHMYLFDVEGNQLLDEPVRGCEGRGLPRDLTMSVDGSFYGFTTSEPGLAIKKTVDGSDLWSWRGEEAAYGVAGFGLNSDGTALVFKGKADRDGYTEAHMLWVESDGVVSDIYGADFIRAPSPVDVGAIGDGKSAWVVHNNRLWIVSYETASPESHDN